MRKQTMQVSVARLVVLFSIIGCTANVDAGSVTVIRLEDPKKPDDPKPVQACLANNNAASCENLPVTLTETPVPDCAKAVVIAKRTPDQAPEASGVASWWDNNTGYGSVVVGNLDYNESSDQKALWLWQDVVDAGFKKVDVPAKRVELPAEVVAKLYDVEGLPILAPKSLTDFPRNPLGTSPSYSHVLVLPDISHAGKSDYVVWFLGMKLPLADNDLQVIGAVSLKFADAKDQQGATYTAAQLSGFVWHMTIDPETRTMILVSQSLDPDSTVQKSIAPTLRLTVPFSSWSAALAASTSAVFAAGAAAAYPEVTTPNTAMRLFLEISTALEVRAESVETRTALLSILPPQARKVAEDILFRENLIAVGEEDKSIADVLQELESIVAAEGSVMAAWRAIGNRKYGTHETAALHPAGRMVTTGLTRVPGLKGTFFQTVNGTRYFGLDIGDPAARISAGEYVVRNGIHYVPPETAPILAQMQGNSYLPAQSQVSLVDDAPAWAGALFYTTEAYLHGGDLTPTMLQDAPVMMLTCNFK